MTDDADQIEQAKKSLSDLINTPFKKTMLVIQVSSYFLIVGSPFIGGGIGALLKLSTKQVGGLALGIFILGEVLFYGSLIFLGKEVVKMLQQKMKGWFKKKKELRK